MSPAHRSVPATRSGPARRGVALAFIGALALGACGSSTTATTATIAPPTTKAAPATTTGTVAPSSTAKPADGKVQLKIVTTPYGKAIGRGDGKVLYAWDKEADAGNTTVCLDAACLDKWPPLTATDFAVGDGLDAKAFTIVDRPDGTKQVALNGKRLYAMKVDEPGDANCQGAEGWWILNPDGTKNTNKTAAKP